MGYQQYGMMFVFAVTVVMVAVYVNARACLKNHSPQIVTHILQKAFSDTIWEKTEDVF